MGTNVCNKAVTSKTGQTNDNFDFNIVLLQTEQKVSIHKTTLLFEVLIVAYNIGFSMSQFS